jgi:putative cell wall-binding protein
MLVVALPLPAVALPGSEPSPPKSAQSAIAPASTACIGRIAGATRYDTAVEISRSRFTSADTVVVSTGADWPDALSGAPLAAANDAPLLLVLPALLPDVVANEIGRLGAERVIILGGTGAVNTTVQTALQNLSGVTTVERVAGTDRYGTAAAIATELQQFPGTSTDAFVATGANFPDALGASAIAASRGMPILLTLPGLLPPVTSAAISNTSVSTAYVLGGTGAVSANVENALRAQLGQNSVQRWWGPDRYATCVEVVKNAKSAWSSDVSLGVIGLSSGAVFPDALAAGAALGREGRAQLLTTPNTLAAPTAAYMQTLAGSTTTVWIYGGTGAVSETVAQQAGAIICEAAGGGGGTDPGDGAPMIEVFGVVQGCPEGTPICIVEENKPVTVNAIVEDAFFDGSPVEGATVTFTWKFPTGDVQTQDVTDATGVASSTQNAGPASWDEVLVQIRAEYEGDVSVDDVKFDPCTPG